MSNGATVLNAQSVQKPGFIDKLRSSLPWFDHVMRAVDRYQRTRGDFFAAGITYFSVLAIFPLLMIVFATAGFVLASNPELLEKIKDGIAEGAPGSMGTQLESVVDTAITQRRAVGVIGVIGALYTGLGWIGKLREALTAQWDIHPLKESFLGQKSGDLIALLGLLLALIFSFSVSAIGGSSLALKIVEFFGMEDLPGIFLILRAASIALSIVASFALFLWVIAKLPRKPVGIRNALWAALLAAVFFEGFKQLATIYLKSVMGSPAGATFGPIIGIMVFLFFTWRIVLFCTAWASTSDRIPGGAHEPVPVPAPARITVRTTEYTRPATQTTVGLVGTGAAVGIALGAVLGLVKGKQKD